MGHKQSKSKASDYNPRNVFNDQEVFVDKNIAENQTNKQDQHPARYTIYKYDFT